jgi:hypothetical protein
LHGKQAQGATVLIDTTVQEKNITHSTNATDAKLAMFYFSLSTSCYIFTVYYNFTFL